MKTFLVLVAALAAMLAPTISSAGGNWAIGISAQFGGPGAYYAPGYYPAYARQVIIPVTVPVPCCYPPASVIPPPGIPPAPGLPPPPGGTAASSSGTVVHVPGARRLPGGKCVQVDPVTGRDRGQGIDKDGACYVPD